MWSKIAVFFKENKKKLISIALTLGVLIAISVAALLILEACGVIYYDDEGMALNTDLFDNFINSWYGWVVLILLQVLITSLLCFIPGASMAFILLIQSFFSRPWQAFTVAFIGVLLSSIIMYLIGRVGGYRICEKLLGKEDCRKASDLLNHKGVIYFPLMMMFPVFPDDALVMIAGTLKMSMKWFLPSIVFGRGIGVCTIVFGISGIPYEKFTTPLHWIGFVMTCAILIFAIFFLAYKFNKYLEKHNVKKEEAEKKIVEEAQKLYAEELLEIEAEKSGNAVSEDASPEGEDSEAVAEDTTPESETLAQEGETLAQEGEQAFAERQELQTEEAVNT